MAINYYSPIDMNKLEIIEPRIHNSPTAPANPVVGQIYYDTAVNTMYFYNGGWIDIKGDVQEVLAGDGLTGGGSGGSVTLTVGAGTGITVAADTVGLDTTNTRNVDHATISVFAGDGLTGGGTIDNNVTLNVVATASSGITVGANAIALTNYAALTQNKIMMWGAGGQLENAPITRTVDQSNVETITINGNLTVTGTTTSVNSNEVNIGDAIIKLNFDETGTASQNAGFEVERGTDANVSFIWDEAADRFSTVDQKFHVGSIDTFTPTYQSSFYMYDNAAGETGEIKRSTYNAVANLLGAPIHFSLDVAQTGVVTKASNTYTVTHNLGTKAIIAQVVQYSNYETVMVDVARPTNNTITVSFASAVADNAFFVILSASKRTGDSVAGSVEGDSPAS